MTTISDNQLIGMEVKSVDDHLVIFNSKEDRQPFFYIDVQQKSRYLLKKGKKKHMQLVFEGVFSFESSNNDVFENFTKYLIESLIIPYLVMGQRVPVKLTRCWAAMQMKTKINNVSNYS